MKMRQAIHITGNDRFPVMFRMNCERTPFDPQTGEDTSLLEEMKRLATGGYLLFDHFPYEDFPKNYYPTREEMKNWVDKNKHKALNYGLIEEVNDERSAG